MQNMGFYFNACRSCKLEKRGTLSAAAPVAALPFSSTGAVSGAGLCQATGRGTPALLPEPGGHEILSELLLPMP